MSAVAPVSAQMSSASFVAASSGIGNAAGLEAAGAASGAAGVQTTSFVSMMQQGASVEGMAALALALLLSKSSESKEKDEAWKMLVGLAMLGALGNQGQSISFAQTSTSIAEAYGAGAVAAASQSSLNMQG